MKVILTSFRDAENWKGDKFSIARWQPRGLHYTEFPIPIAPFYGGQPLRNLSPPDYQVKYNRILDTHSEELRRFFSSQLPERQFVLLCWCNPDRQKGYDKLYCHRILVGYWIELNCPQIEVIYTDGAENPVWENPAEWRKFEKEFPKLEFSSDQ